MINKKRGFFQLAGLFKEKKKEEGGGKADERKEKVSGHRLSDQVRHRHSSHFLATAGAERKYQLFIS